MKHFVLPKDSREGVFFCLRGKDFHYLHRVRRLQEGQTLDCLSPQGEHVRCRCTKVTRDCLYLEPVADQVAINSLQSGDPADTAPTIRLHLVQAMPKGAKTDDILRMAVELGISSFVLVKTARTISDQREGWAAKKSRLEVVAREAAQQAGTQPPEICDPILSRQLPDHIARSGAKSVAFILHEHELEPGAFHRWLTKETEHVYILVGPEGGWAPEEVQACMLAGIIPAYLGQGVLRTEHAGIAGLAVAKVIYGEHSRWNVV